MEQGMDIRPRIRRYIAHNLLFGDNGLKYDDDASFLEEGIVDSLGIMDLVFFIEDTFGVTVGEEELTPENFDSVNKLADYIHRRLLAPAS
jgi:acyl carrier protein